MPVVGSIWLSHQFQHPLPQFGRAVAREGGYIQLAARRFGRGHSRQQILRQGKDDRDRLKLGDDDKRPCVGGMDDIALVDTANAGTAIDWRGDIGIAELHPRILNRGLIGLDGRDERVHGGGLGVRLLAAGKAFGGCVFIPLQIQPGVRQCGFVLGLRGQCTVPKRPGTAWGPIWTSRSPVLTSCPSRKSTLSSCPSTRAWMLTVL